MELHFKTHMKGLPFYGRLVSPAEIALFVDHMWRHGRYAVINRRDNRDCDHCTELLIARVPLVRLVPEQRRHRARETRST